MYDALQETGVEAEDFVFTAGGDEDDAGRPVVEFEPRRAIAYPSALLPRRCPECRGELAAEPVGFLFRADREGLALFTTAWYCTECPAFIINADEVEEVLRDVWPGRWKVQVLGCMELAAADPEGFGTEENPAVLTVFESLERKHGKRSRLDLSLTRASRNGPCSCGSGKKYKRCCGRARHAS